MKPKFYILLPVFLSLYLQSFAQNTETERKLVFIIVDGIAADMLSRVATPNLDEIAADGSFSEAYVGGEKDSYSETPTISAVGYNSLLTGVWVNKHQVFGNAIKKPNYNYPTIFRLFENEFPKKHTAIFSTWEDNRTKLVGEGLVGTNFLKIDYAYDGFENDTLLFPHDDESHYIKNIDDNVATEAAKYIEQHGPDLSWVYLQYSDDIGHKYGDSPQLDKAIQFEDELIGRVYEAVKHRQSSEMEDWLVIVTTDHGRTFKTGKGHGGQTDRERSTWIAMNQKANPYFQDHLPAVVDILPTMSEFLRLDPPASVRQEWDGVPLIGTVDAMDLKASLKDDQINLTWKNLSGKAGTAKIYVAYSNQTKNGAQDMYTYLGTVNLPEESANFPLDKPSPFFKILMETPNHYLNRWIISSDINTNKEKSNTMKLGAFSMSLNVKDLTTSKEFYEKLGFTVFAGGMDKDYLIMKNGNALIGLFQGMFESNILTFNPGWDENAENIETFDDVRTIQKHLKDQHIQLMSGADTSTTGPASLMLTDPDGNVILIDQHR